MLAETCSSAHTDRQRYRRLCSNRRHDWFIWSEQHIRFNINITVARQANLKLSSQLLKLATIVD